jgi:hypothetical protein
MKAQLAMRIPPIVSPQEWEAARLRLLVKVAEAPGPLVLTLHSGRQCDGIARESVLRKRGGEHRAADLPDPRSPAAAVPARCRARGDSRGIGGPPSHSACHVVQSSPGTHSNDNGPSTCCRTRQPGWCTAG